MTEPKIQTIAEAEAVENKLSIRIDELERRIDGATAAAASDVAALADGSPINTSEITRLQAELLVLRDAHETAVAAVDRAEHLASVRETLQRKDRVEELIHARGEIALKASDLLDQVTNGLADLVLNGRALAAALGHGRDMLGPEGYVSVRPSDLASVLELSTMVQGHFSSLIPGWRMNAGGEGPVRSLAQSIDAELGSIRNELDIVGGFQLDPDDERLVRAAMAARAAAKAPEQLLITGD